MACSRASREARDALRIWFCIDTLEYLQRGGRVGARAGVARRRAEGQADPLARAEITPVERVRTSGRAFERMVDYMHERRDDGADGWVMQHIQAPERAAARSSSAAASCSAASRSSSPRSGR